MDTDAVRVLVIVSILENLVIQTKFSMHIICKKVVFTFKPVF